MKDGLSHAINVFLTLVLSLLEVDIGNYLSPARLLVDLFVLFSEPLFLLSIFLGSFSFFLIFSVLELFQLSSALFPASILLFILLLLTRSKITLFYLS